MLYTKGVWPKLTNTCSPAFFRLTEGYNRPLATFWNATPVIVSLQTVVPFAVRTNFYTILGVERCPITKVYATANYIASGIRRSKLATNILS